MNIKKIIVSLGMLLLPAFPALAEDSSFEGDANVTGEMANVSGDKAKFNEYRDIRKNGLYSEFLFKFDSDNFFLQGKASDIGYHTQHYRLEGGEYGKFKFYLDYNEIPHNFTDDAKTFYNGVGSNTLTNKFGAVLPTTDTSGWNQLDYAIRRNTSEGGFTLQLTKPFYAIFSASHEERTGTVPTGVATTSPGGFSLEIPQPVDYTTDIIKAEIGYAKKPIFASLSAEYSNFDNANHQLFFFNPAGPAGNGDALNLPPSNQYYKIAFRGSTQLPMNSKFNMNLAISRATDEADLFNSYVTAVVNPITLSSSLFHGQVDTQNYQAVLTSNPVSFLSTKIFYKYYERHNSSDQIATTDPGFAGGLSFTNQLFSYNTNKAGIDLWFKLPARFTLQTGYSYLVTDRIRGDIPETRDNDYTTELTWRGRDFLTPKIGYQHLERGADHGVLNKMYAADQATENAIAGYIGRFDATNQSRDVYKASVDIYPLDRLNFNIGFKYSMVDYQDTVLGLRRVNDYVTNVDGSYAIGSIIQLNAYVDYESKRSYQFQRQLSAAATAAYNPYGPTQNATNFNWDARISDYTFSFGANAEIFIVPKKLTMVLQFDNVQSNGGVDLTYLNSAALAAGTPAGTRTNDNIDLGAWDDYTLRAIMAKLIYTPSKPLTIAAGYAYESYSYNDNAWNGYVLVPATAGTNGAFLTGAYANPSYHASVVFLSLNYRY
ncbi:MAG TPA: MtrB/PioB family decaheme-associated outer membrane protein [Nitrospirota bacterium]|nr:MtrB/PioB family decaheme-associated outer membrane protein [Nitrospirota bacterium]